ncbi:MAG: SRPBCC family protein [Myxococcota bacterium]
MSEVHLTRVVAASPEAVWAALADVGGVHRFHPYVERSPLTEGSAEGGVGAGRTCHFYDGNHVVEEVIRWEPLEAVEVAIVRGSMPLKDARAGFQLTPEGAGTRIDLRMSYTPKLGPLGALMDVLMMRRKFRTLLAEVLEGLDVHVRTGQVVGEGGQLAPAPAWA